MSKSYPLLVLPQFMASAAQLSKDIRSSLVKAMYLLSQDVRHPGLQTKKVNGARGCIFECRVDQSTRLIYDLRDGALRCWYVGAHDAALKFASSAFIGEGHGLSIDDIAITDVPEGLLPVLMFLQTGEAADDFVSADPELT